MAHRVSALPIDARTPMSVAAPVLLASRAEPLFVLAATPGLASDPDAVHDLRVASRRLREALRVVAPFYPAKATHSWARRLRGLTRAMGPVRDCDVAIEAFREISDEMPAEALPAIGLMVGYLAGLREGRLEILTATLRSRDLGARGRSFERYARQPKRHSAGTMSVDEFGRAAIAQRLAVTEAEQPVALNADAVEAQHALRIHYKRLRYAVELFEPLFGERFPDVHKGLTLYQDALGELHDVRVWAQMADDARVLGVVPVAAWEPLSEYLRAADVSRFERFAELTRRISVPELLGL